MGLIIETAPGFRDLKASQQQSPPLLGSCACGHEGLARYFYRSQSSEDPGRNEDTIILSTGIFGRDNPACKDGFESLCVCAEDGQCYTVEDPHNLMTLYVDSYCDDRGCHNYAIAYSPRARCALKSTTTDSRLPCYALSDGGPYPSLKRDASAYLRIVSISCNGCAAIQSAKCSNEPFQPAPSVAPKAFSSESGDVEDEEED